ncbi:MAG: tetratricopeptide repeat protein [Pseudobdellovibrionaceae bacterium]
MLKRIFKVSIQTLVLSLGLSSSFLFSSRAQAQIGNDNRSSMDNMLIDKLEQIYQHLAPKDSSKVPVTLRLADLYAERARTESMKEIDQGCTLCKVGEADRKKALRLYTEVMDRAPEAVQSKVLIQVGHLYQLTGENAKAISFYNKILQENKTPEVKADAQLSLGEIYFKARDFAKAQGFYQDFLKNVTTGSRNLAAYRSAWCAFNLGDIDNSVKQMEQILKTPQAKVDPQFQEEVSRDYATFLSKKSLEKTDIENLFQLSPESVRVANVKGLALDLERVGKKNDALNVWTFVFNSLSKPEDRLAAKISLAQLYFDVNNKKEGIESFESAMNLWPELKVCQSSLCEELHRRSRQFVVSWHQLEKKSPTAELWAAYRAYLKNFPEDADMNLYAANVARELKDWNGAWEAYHKALASQGKDADKLETTLVAMLELAEASKNAKFITESYELYLSQSLRRSKAFEVSYQKAHQLYEQAQYEPASQELRRLALDQKGEAKIRKQAADLSLDALVLMKDESRLKNWAAEYAQTFTEGSKEFSQIVQKAILNHSASIAADKGSEAAYAELGEFNPSLASPEDNIKFFKNKLILAEKLNKFSEAQSAAESLLQQAGLSPEDAEYAWERKASLAEMRLDFASAVTATHKLQKSLKPDEKLLKLAIFSDLAGQSSSLYYDQYLHASKDEENKKLVLTELVRNSRNPEKEIESHRDLLGKSPQLLAQLYTEVYAKSSSESVLKKVLKDPSMKATDSGKLLARVSFLKDFSALKTKLLAHKLETKNDRKLAASLKGRVDLLGKLENLTKQAIEAGDWTSQLVSLDCLAKESERFYSEILSAPVPSNLGEEEQQQYLQLLSAQARPFQSKSLEAKSKVEQFWKSANWQASLKTSWQQSALRNIILLEVKALQEIAPPEYQRDLAELSTDKKEIATMRAERPSLQELQMARNLVQENPLDKKALEALLELEKRSENSAMTQYLQTRLENLTKSSEKGVL